MAITATALTAGTSSANSSAYSTASITPPANQLIRAAVMVTDDGTPGAITLSGNGLTWVLVATVTWSTTDPQRRLSYFRAMGAAPTSEAVTISVASSAATGCTWSIVAFDGVDTGGTNGSAAVVQSATNKTADDNTATSLTVTLAAFGSTNNGVDAAFGSNANEAQSPGSGFTELDDTAATLPTGRLETEWRTDNDTSVDASSTNVFKRGGIAVELNAAASGDTPVAGAQAAESDTALAGSAAIGVAGSQATETDTGLAGSPRVTAIGSQAAETDAAFAGSISTGQPVFVIGVRAVEIDAARRGRVLVGMDRSACEAEPGSDRSCAVPDPSSRRCTVATARSR